MENRSIEISWEDMVTEVFLESVKESPVLNSDLPQQRQRLSKSKSENDDSESPTSSYETDCEQSDSDTSSLCQYEDSDNEWMEDVPVREPFEDLPEPRINIENAVNKTPMDYFKVFFNIMFLKQLASWINGHAKVLLGGLHKPQSRIKHWRDTNETELLTFLSILFYMDLVRLNRIGHYWRKEHLVKFSLCDHMSRDRFLLIFRMLYFTAEDVSKTIYVAVEPLIDYFHQMMREIVYPSKELVIGESMVLSPRQLGVRQYLKNKGCRGVKLYVLTDSQGLVLRLHLNKGSADSEGGSKGHVENIVFNLLDPYLNAGHSVYLDNFYTSVDLAEKLLVKKTFCTGPLQMKRKKNPTIVTRKKLLKGCFIHRYNQKGVCVMKWMDKRQYLTISTEHSHRMTKVVSRQSLITSKPFMLVKYKQFMKGLDRHDQTLAYYPCERKAINWFTRIGINILQTMFVNAYLLYEKGTNMKISLEDFRKIILFELLPPKNVSYARSQMPAHMPAPLERNCSGTIKRRNCARCLIVHKKRKSSGMYCPDCDVGLCLACYGPYHQEKR